MKLKIKDTEIILNPKEFLEYHDGREGHPFNLDVSICNVFSKAQAEEYKAQLTSLYPFSRFKMEEIHIMEVLNGEFAGTFEVLFAASDFIPLITD